MGRWCTWWAALLPAVPAAPSRRHVVFEIGAATGDWSADFIKFQREEFGVTFFPVMVEALERHRTRLEATAAQLLVERFDRRGTEPFELFRSEVGQNSGTSAKKKRFRNVQHFLKYRGNSDKI